MGNSYVFDFDKIVDRNNTNCLKYDFKAERGLPADVLPLWVADMDFPTVPEVTEKLKSVANHGIFGYTEVKDDYFDAVSGWFLKHFNWETKKEWLVKTPGVVYAIAQAVRAFSKEGDGVMLQNPVYYPFSEVIVDNNRKLVNSPLLYNPEGDGYDYTMNFEEIEEKIVSENVKIFLLCNPHNPVGRVWSREELTRLGDICNRHNVLVVSDEIHCDFTYEGFNHTVYASLGREYEKNCIVCTAPSKTFNLAGLQVSNIFIPNADIRKKFLRELRSTGYSQLNTCGLYAAQTAYESGELWLSQLKEYIAGNLLLVRSFVNERLKGIRLIEPQGTYLVWLDCSGLGISDEELNNRIVNKAGLWLDAGNVFGKEGDNFQRINIACPRSVLLEALERLTKI